VSNLLKSDPKFGKNDHKPSQSVEIDRKIPIDRKGMKQLEAWQKASKIIFAV
jgi:hypothetical protein